MRLGSEGLGSEGLGLRLGSEVLGLRLASEGLGCLAEAGSLSQRKFVAPSTPSSVRSVPG